MSGRAPWPSVFSVAASTSATGTPYWFMPEKRRFDPMLPFGAPTLSRSADGKLILLMTTEVRLMTRQHNVGLLLMAASGSALKTVPLGTTQSKGASVPFVTGRSLNG